ncbi:MAG: hypothetical protein Q9215_002712 [Flavoplaca cf. flavocitrina]
MATTHHGPLSTSQSPASLSSSSSTVKGDEHDNEEAGKNSDNGDEDGEEGEEEENNNDGNDSDKNANSDSNDNGTDNEGEDEEDNESDDSTKSHRPKIRKIDYNAAPKSCSKLMDDCLYLPSKGIKVADGDSPWGMRTLRGSYRLEEERMEDGEVEGDIDGREDERDVGSENGEIQAHGTISNRGEDEQSIRKAQEKRRQRDISTSSW